MTFPILYALLKKKLGGGITGGGGSGGLVKRYLHKLTLFHYVASNDKRYVVFDIFSSNNTPMLIGDLLQYFTDNNITNLYGVICSAFKDSDLYLGYTINFSNNKMTSVLNKISSSSSNITITIDWNYDVYDTVIDLGA